MQRLQDKVAVITGAGRGIGRATAEKFATEGAIVIVAEVDPESGAAVERDIRSQGGQADFIPVDVSDRESVGNLFGTVQQRYRRLDILVNNAGILRDRTLKKLEEEDFDRVIEVNLKGVYLCTRQAAELMRNQDGGVIVNATSGVALYGNFGQTNYVASKAGVIGMTRVWARELARDGIRVNAVAPGFIETEMTAGIPEKVVAMMNAKIPLGKWGRPGDVANAYCFLASDEAAYITGAVLSVDGGVVI